MGPVRDVPPVTGLPAATTQEPAADVPPAPQAVGAGATRARMEWMDTLRGLAILLMLLWHATAVPQIYGIEMPAALVAVNDALLPFRMPTLMFLSGLLLPRSLSKPLGTYLRGKVALIWWPYFLWVVLYLVMSGTQTPLWHPKLYIAKGYLWYLFFLGVYYAVAPLLRRVPTAVVCVALLAASFVVDDPLVHRLLYFAVFFFLGAWVAEHGGDVVGRVGRSRVLVVALAALALALAVASALVDLRYVSLTVPGSVAGIVVAILAARRLPSARTAGLRFVGRNSIVFYVAHFPVMQLAAMWLGGLGAPWWVALGVLLGAGLAVTWPLAVHRDARALRWLFEMPGVAVRRRSPAPTTSPVPAPAAPAAVTTLG